LIFSTASAQPVDLNALRDPGITPEFRAYLHSLLQERRLAGGGSGGGSGFTAEFRDSPPPAPSPELFDYYDATLPEDLPLVSAANGRDATEDVLIIVSCTLLTTFVLSQNLPDF
jgi:hypothetical protein